MQMFFNYLDKKYNNGYICSSFSVLTDLKKIAL
jgi:hypothetical protein